MKCVLWFLIYCIFISACCCLKYGINRPLFNYLLLKSWFICVFLKDLNFCLPVVKEEASLPRLQNPFLYLIMSQMKQVHTFITHLFMIPCKVTCSSYYAVTYWILISNLKTWKDVLQVPCIGALNWILSMPRSKKCSFPLSPTELCTVCWPPLSLLHRHHDMNYAISSTFPLPTLY